MFGFLPGRRAQQWQRRIKRFAKSRESLAEFCRQEGVSPQTFSLETTLGPNGHPRSRQQSSMFSEAPTFELSTMLL